MPPTEFIAEDFYDEWMRRGIPKKGAILFTTEAPLGEVAQIMTDEKLAFAQRIIILQADEVNLSNDYLLYALQDRILKGRIEAKASGTTVVGIKAAELKKVYIDLPPITKQRQIAEICKSIDSKMESNMAIDDNLQQQAWALFQRAFDAASESVPFTDIIQIWGGGTPKTGNPEYWNGEIPFFTPKDVGTPYTLRTEKTITEAGLAHCNSRLYNINTVFVTARGTVGKVGLAGVPMAMNQSCYALTGRGIDQLLVYHYTLHAVEALKHKASGAVFDAITTRDFESERLPKLSDSVEMELLNAVKPLFAQILRNDIESRRLVSLRDALLPRLMSGEIDVSAVQL